MCMTMCLLILDFCFDRYPVMIRLSLVYMSLSFPITLHVIASGDRSGIAKSCLSAIDQLRVVDDW